MKKLLIILLILVFNIMACEQNFYGYNKSEPDFILGICVLGIETISSATYDLWLADIKDAGFTHIKLGSVDWDDPWGNTARYKGYTLTAMAEGFHVHFGFGSTNVTLTASNYGDFEDAVLDLAAWAETNNMPVLKMGNELEMYIDGTTLTVSGLITNLKATATAVKQVYSGIVGYTCFAQNVEDWAAAGKGDIDVLSSNIYYGWDIYNPAHDNGEYWDDKIDTLVATFGVDGTDLGEFGVNSSGYSYYSEDFEEQAILTKTMLDYIKASGMKTAYYFMYHDISWLDDFGVRDIDGNYNTYVWNMLKGEL